MQLGQIICNYKHVIYLHSFKFSKVTKVQKRPKFLNDAKNEALKNNLTENYFNTAWGGVMETNFPGSWVSKTPTYSASARTTVLTDENKQSRTLFCLNYIYGPKNFWENVVFSEIQ